VRSFHWLVAFCVIAALVLMEFHEFAAKGSALRKGMTSGHMQFGMAVLLLFLPRVVIALSSPKPPITPRIPAWQHFLSKVVHFALYGLLIATPLAGFLLAQSEGKSLIFLGMQVPVLIAKNHAFAESVEELHELFGNLMIWIAALHAAAALYHHFVRKDDTLRRML
jgi:cytochrome b561